MAPSLIDRTRRWFRTHLVIPLKQMSWHERLVLVALGFWFGIFPIPGLSTPILLFGFLVVNALVAKQLTMPETTVATAVNILATPFCLALMPLWMALGGYIFGLGARCEASQIIDEFSSSGFFEALSKFAACLGAASFAWMTATPVVVFIIIALRSKANESHRHAGGRIDGDFEVLSEEVDPDLSDLEHANLDDIGNEMARIRSSSSPGIRAV